MGITSHTHMHAHKHTYTHKEIPLLFFFFAPLWRKVNGCNRKEEDPVEKTHMLLASSPPTPPCLPFFFPLSAHIQTSWHTLCLWGEIMLSQSRRVFSCPPELRHNITQHTVSAGFPTPVVSSFFHEFWSECIHIMTTMWTADPFTQTMCQAFLFSYLPSCMCLG